MVSGEKPLEQILAYFQENDWPLDEVDTAAGRVFTTYRGRNVVLEVEICLNLEWKLLQVTLLLPEMAPPRRLAEAMAVVNRINYKLPLGHFEIGPEDRQLAFYTAVPLTDQMEVGPLFETLLAWTVDIVDQEHPRLMQAIYASGGADEATLEDLDEPPRRYDA